MTSTMQGGIFKYLTLVWPALWYLVWVHIPLYSSVFAPFPASLPFPAHSNFLDIELPNNMLVYKLSLVTMFLYTPSYSHPNPSEHGPALD